MSRRLTKKEFDMLTPRGQAGYRKYWGDTPPGVKEDSLRDVRAEQLIAGGERKVVSDSLLDVQRRLGIERTRGGLVSDSLTRVGKELDIAAKQRAAQEPLTKLPPALAAQIKALRDLGFPQARIDSIVGKVPPAGTKERKEYEALMKRLMGQISSTEKGLRRERDLRVDATILDDPGISARLVKADSLQSVLDSLYTNPPGTEPERAPIRAPLRLGRRRPEDLDALLRSRPDTTRGKTSLDFLW